MSKRIYVKTKSIVIKAILPSVLYCKFYPDIPSLEKRKKLTAISEQLSAETKKALIWWLKADS
jgi:hypothetical protein